jgi:hypothetical protein
MKLLLTLVLALCVHALSAAQNPGPTWGLYPNRPLGLDDLVPPDGRHFLVSREFDYVDPSKYRWKVPPGLITDGASIPFPFWSIIGAPFEGLHREAAVVHDAACCAQIEPWKDVHRMFYNAMRCSRVGWLKAKTMYFAVRVAGPRWTHLNHSMPAGCTKPLSIPTAHVAKLFEMDFGPNVVDKVWGQIAERNLTLPETKAVAQPFFTHSQMTDARARTFVMQLKKRGAKPEERVVITVSVVQSERFSESEVKAIQQSVEKQDPSLEQIDAQADAMRSRKIVTQRLFPEVPELAAYF